MRAGTGPLRWVAKDAHFPAVAREETSSPQKNAYRGPETWFTSGWRIYFPSLCCGGRYQVCCLEWLKDRICANWLNGPRGDNVKGGVIGVWQRFGTKWAIW